MSFPFSFLVPIHSRGNFDNIHPVPKKEKQPEVPPTAVPNPSESLLISMVSPMEPPRLCISCSTLESFSRRCFGFQSRWKNFSRSPSWKCKANLGPKLLDDFGMEQDQGRNKRENKSPFFTNKSAFITYKKRQRSPVSGKVKSVFPNPSKKIIQTT